MSRLIGLGRALHRNRFVRFLFTGGLNTLFGYGLFVLGLAAHLRPEAALALATAIGAVFNYFTTARFVFGHKAVNHLPLFVATYAVLYLFNAAAIRILLSSGLQAAAAQALLVPAMAVLSFLAFRAVVFKTVPPR